MHSTEDLEPVPTVAPRLHSARTEGEQISAGSRLVGALTVLYGADAAAEVAASIIESAQRARFSTRRELPDRASGRRSPVIVAYPDHVIGGDSPPLVELRRFLDGHVDRAGSAGLHLLPPYVADADDGFAVVDHDALHPRLGSWQQLRDLARGRTLMLDLVMNHVSTSHEWVREFIETEGRSNKLCAFDDAVSVEWGTRPRSANILQPFETGAGTRWLWCTYGRSQADVNLSNPVVFTATAETLIGLIVEGVDIVRLDALPHTWKRLPGGPNQPEVRILLRALRAVTDLVDPSVDLIAESDHRPGQTSYVGTNLAQYDNHLAVPALVLAAVLLGEPDALAEWVNDLESDPHANDGHVFLMTHDGIHLRPMDPPLDPAATARLLAELRSRDVVITCAGGTDQAYEINSSLRTIFTRDDEFDEAAYLLAHGVMMALPGIPSLYLPTLFALESPAAADPINPRSSNRYRYQADEIRSVLTGSDHQRVYRSISHLLQTWSDTAAFHASDRSRAWTDGTVLHVVRTHAAVPLHVVANVGRTAVTVDAPFDGWRDVLTDRCGTGPLDLDSLQVRWLEPELAPQQT